MKKALARLSWPLTESEIERVHHTALAILSTHYPAHIDPKLDARIRKTFPIAISPEAMRADCRRWQAAPLTATAFLYPVMARRGPHFYDSRRPDVSFQPPLRPVR